MLTHPTCDRLEAIGLTGMAQAMHEQRHAGAIFESLSFEERLGLLVEREAAEREAKRQRTSFGRGQMARSDMSDLEWEFIKAVLPNKTRGKKRVDDRRVINGIFYVLRTGIPWADLPEQYGPPTTVYNRFNRWSYAGHWDRIMEAIADAHNVDMVMVDGTSVRAHHSATTLKKRPAPLFRSLTGRIRDENTCTYKSGWVADPI